MSRVRRPPYLFLVALLAALAAGCGSAASAGAPISGVPVASADEAMALQQRCGQVIGIPTLSAVDPEMGSEAPGIGLAIDSNTVRQVSLVRSG
jgi:hypothetical protein